MRLDLITFLTATLIAFQARVNGELSDVLGNPIQAATVSFGSGLIVISLFAFAHHGMRQGIFGIKRGLAEGGLKRWNLFAGMLGGIFVAIQTNTVTIIGVAVYSVASISGQTASSLIVDAFGLSGGAKKHITFRRILASLITVLAVLVSVWDRIDAHDLSLFPVILAGLAGAIVGIQRALNGKINIYSGQHWTTSLLNFIMGTTFLLILTAILIPANRYDFKDLPTGPWWMYTGGVLGVIYIAYSATIVQQLGVLASTLLSVGGNLFGALLIDWLVPVHGVRISGWLIAGICLSFLGVIVGGVSSQQQKR
ncbi:MAG: DMT family transporter [Candidatus Nanopelagicaceae bacterium]